MYFISALFQTLGITWGTLALVALVGAALWYVWENGLERAWHDYQRWEKRNPILKKRKKNKR